MEPYIYNFPKLYTGNTFNGLKFAIKKNGKELDLSDAIIRLEVYCGGITYLELTSKNNSITITNPKKGEFEINPFLVEMESGSYEYYLQFQIENNFYTYIKGKITVDKFN